METSDGAGGPGVEQLAADFGRIVQQAARGVDGGLGAVDGAARGLGGDASSFSHGGVLRFAGIGRHRRVLQSKR